jgi:hypothetical protein
MAVVVGMVIGNSFGVIVIVMYFPSCAPGVAQGLLGCVSHFVRHFVTCHLLPISNYRAITISALPGPVSEPPTPNPD